MSAPAPSAAADPCLAVNRYSLAKDRCLTSPRLGSDHRGRALSRGCTFAPPRPRGTDAGPGTLCVGGWSGAHGSAGPARLMRREEARVNGRHRRQGEVSCTIWLVVISLDSHTDRSRQDRTPLLTAQHLAQIPGLRKPGIRQCGNGVTLMDFG